MSSATSAGSGSLRIPVPVGSGRAPRRGRRRGGTPSRARRPGPAARRTTAGGARRRRAGVVDRRRTRRGQVGHLLERGPRAAGRRQRPRRGVAVHGPAQTTTADAREDDLLLRGPVTTWTALPVVIETRDPGLLADLDAARLAQGGQGPVGGDHAGCRSRRRRPWRPTGPGTGPSPHRGRASRTARRPRRHGGGEDVEVVAEGDLTGGGEKGGLRLGLELAATVSVPSRPDGRRRGRRNRDGRSGPIPWTRRLRGRRWPARRRPPHVLDGRARGPRSVRARRRRPPRTRSRRPILLPGHCSQDQR